MIDEDVGERVRMWTLYAKWVGYFIHIGDASFRCDFLTARYHLASFKGRFKVDSIYFIITKETGHGKTAASYARLLFIVLHFYSMGYNHSNILKMMPPLLVSWLVDKCVDLDLENMSMIVSIVRQLTWKGMPHELDDQCNVCLSLITC